MTRRLKPLRAGIVGLWDYTVHTFDFADGRVVLRGANGSGKTKALEVLFPFVLDGRLDARRLDPFSGENRTMKENLLWGRTGESGYGYAWLEFGDGQRTVTVGVGMVARRSQPSPHAWFFVAEGRVGEEVVLVEPDGRPRTRAQLREALGADVVVERARDHRARVDAALFGLGVERYEAMLDLVLTLRRPMLAKDLDPALLSETLSRGLRPLDDELLEKVARSFDDLDAVQRELERLARADDAARAFLAEYRGYLRSHARHRADLAVDAAATVGRAAARLDAAHAAVDEARATEALAEAEQSAVADRLVADRARRDGLRGSEAFRSAADLEHLVRSVHDLDEARRRAGGSAEQADAERRRRIDEAAAARREAAEAGRQVARSEPAALDAATAAGIELIDTGADTAAVRSWASAGRAARGADLDAVRPLLAAAVEADQRLEQADEALGEASTAEDAAAEVRAAAEAALGAARDDLRQAVAGWAGAHGSVVTDEDAAAVSDAVDAVGGEGIPPGEVWRARTEERRRAAVERRAALRARAADLADQQASLQARRDAVAAEADDAPPPLPWRGSSREGRAGAPLWRLVRFAPGVAGADAAGVEAALEAAGLLDAWVSPDGSVDAAGLDAGLDAGEGTRRVPVDGATLSSVLDVEEQADVPVEVVQRILDAVALGDGPASVTAAGSYRLGPLVGRHAVDAPRYIGATARDAHRAARIAALDDELVALAGDVARVAAQIAELDGSLDALDAAAEALPSVEPARGAVRALDVAVAGVVAARRQVAEATAAVERWRRQRGDRRAVLGREADRRDLPTTAAGLDQVAAAIERFTDAARDLATALERAADRATTAGRAATAESDAAETARAAAVDLAERTREHGARQAEHDALRARVGADVDTVLAEVGAVEGAIEDGERAATAAGRAVQDAASRRGAATGEVDAAAEAVGAAADAMAGARRRLGVLRRPDLAASLGLDPVALDADDDGFLDAVDALVTGVSGADERRKASQTRVTRSLEDLEHALGAGYRPGWDVEDDVIVVSVGDDQGVRAASTFAEALATQRADQEVLLHARERALFEDTLLAAVCRQIHERVRSTRDLVAAMDVEMRSRRLSSGQTVGVAWRPVDSATPEWRRVHGLLDGDPAHFGPDQLETIRRHFATEITAARRAERDEPYQEVLARVLDYRAWRRFELTLVEADGRDSVLTRARHARLSGGEKAASLHLPLFAAANAAFAGAHPDCPRLLALDEAFAGIDDQGRAELLSLTVAFDLDLFMTGFDLWATHPSIPGVAHHDLLHLADDRSVSSLLVLWNGRELVEGPDADAQLALLEGRG